MMVYQYNYASTATIDDYQAGVFGVTVEEYAEALRGVFGGHSVQRDSRWQCHYCGTKHADQSVNKCSQCGGERR